MEFKISSKEDINKIKEFVKSFCNNELKDQFIFFNENTLTFYIRDNYWYANFKLVLDIPVEKSLFISFDLDSFNRALAKFPEGANISIDETKSKVTIYGVKKSNKVSFKYKEVTDFVKNDILNRFNLFSEAKIKDKVTLDLTDEISNKLTKLEKMGIAATADPGTIRYSNKSIDYANKIFIYSYKNLDESIPEEYPVYIALSSVNTMKNAKKFGVTKFNFARNNKFFSGTSSSFEIISAQKKLNFGYPTSDELKFFAPEKKESWWFKFKTNDIIEAFSDFKGIFSEDSYRWEPIQLNLSNTKKHISFSYRDIKISEERDFIPIEFNTDKEPDITETSCIVSSQFIKMFLGETEEAIMTLRPKDLQTPEEGCRGVTLSLNDSETAVFCKMTNLR